MEGPGSSNRWVAAALTSMTQLTYLSLQNRSLNREGDAVMIGQAVGCLQSLRVLDLSNNSLGSDGVKALLAHLSSLAGLKDLRLQEIPIADEVVRFIGETLNALSLPLQRLVCCAGRVLAARRAYKCWLQL